MEVDGDDESSSDEDGDDDDAMDDEGAPSGVPLHEPQQRQEPIVDEDGFQLVQKKGKGRR